MKGAPTAAARRLCDFCVQDLQIALLENAFRRPPHRHRRGKYVRCRRLKIKVFATDEDDAAAKRNEFPAQWRTLTSN